MADGVERLAAEGACRPSGLHERLGRSHELTCGPGADAHAEQVRALGVLVGRLDVLAVLGRSLRLDDDGLVCRIPRERQRADAERLDDRLLEPGAQARLRHRRLGRLDRGEEVVETRGERGHLDLLDADADDRVALARLEVEGPLSGRADGPGEESVGAIEDEESARHRVQCYPLGPTSMAGADEDRGPRHAPGSMRQRLGLNRSRSMARRRGPDARFDLSPRARLIGGWLVAVLLVLGIAGAVRIFGGNADGDAVLSTPTPAASVTRYAITLGTELGEDRVVPASAVTDRFVETDLFAYSVADAPPADSVYVGVRRIGGGPLETVQAATEAQAIPDGPATIGFRVPATNLFAAFGPGSYEMTIALTAEGEPIAAGTFELVATTPASASPGG